MAKKISIRELATLEKNHGHIDMTIKMLLGNEFLVQANITDNAGDQYQVEVVSRNRSQLRKLFDEVASIAFDNNNESDVDETEEEEIEG